MRGCKAIVALLMLGSGIAAADPRVDAIARHADADVAALRAQLPGDDAVRCTLGAIYAARGDLPRASLYLEPCANAQLGDDLTEPVARARRDVHRKVEASELSGINVLTEPEGAWAEIDALPGDRFQTSQLVWVPAGHHVVTVTRADGAVLTSAIDSKPHARGPMLISLALPKPQQIHAGSENLEVDNAGETETAPPPDRKHPPLTPCRFVEGCLTAGPQIDDPLATATPHVRTHAWRAGLRFGGGMFDHTGADARLGFAASGVVSVPIRARLAVVGRIDWSRRGGTTDDTHGVDALGATAGLGVTLARLAPFDLIAGGGARVAVALDDTMDTSRATLGGAAWLEVPMRATPLTFGVRVEQGLTSFAPGARDQAVIAELGIDFL